MSFPETLSTVLPQKRKVENEESPIHTTLAEEKPSTSDIHNTKVTPPKLRRIFEKYSDGSLGMSLYSDTSRSEVVEEQCMSNPPAATAEEVVASVKPKKARSTSAQVLRANFLQRDSIARVDEKPFIDKIDESEEENVPASVPPTDEADVGSLNIPRNLRSHSRNHKGKKRPNPPKDTSTPPTTTTTTAVATVKTDGTTTKETTPAEPAPNPEPIQPYKKLPCRGDGIEKRIAKLKADPWSDATKLTPKSVYCIGCQKHVSLDKRFDYYPGFWETHKRRCPYVQAGSIKGAENASGDGAASSPS